MAAVVVFLHGFGDSGPGVQDWLRVASSGWQGGHFEEQLAAAGVKMVFPSARKRKCAHIGGNYEHAWFDRLEISYEADLGDGVDDSVQSVLRILEDQGCPRSRMVVGGFSMGGGLALAGIPAWGDDLAGIFCLGSFLSENSSVYLQYPPSKAPVYISHGESDTVIPPRWSELTHEKLKRMGFNVQHSVEPNIGHELGNNQLIKLLDWIKEKTTDVTSYSRPTVTYTVQAGENDKAVIVFSVPPGKEDSVIAAPLCARGSFFEAFLGPEPGTIQVAVESPRPHDTAKALGDRVASRLSDPTPPGAVESCQIV
jgi:phospholipase/carboxylesterase